MRRRIRLFLSVQAATFLAAALAHFGVYHFGIVVVLICGLVWAARATRWSTVGR